MSVATHLKILSSFDRWAHGHEPLDHLLSEALGFLRLEVSNALSLRLYHLNETGVLIGASTSEPTESQTFIAFGDGSAYSEVLSHRIPVFNAERETWVAPLDSDSTTFGLVEVTLDVAAQPSDMDQQRDWVALITACLGQALDTRTLQDLARKHAVTSSALTQATSYPEIAGILAKNLLGTKQFFSINLFITNADGEFTGFRTLTTANRHKTYEQDERLENITLADMGLPLVRLLDEARPYLISDLASNPTVSDRIKEWLGRLEIKGIAVFPMRSQGVTYGLIALNNTIGPLYLAEPEMALYQSLADQVSTLVQLGRVAERADYTAAISERQKQAFNELVAGQDFNDMAGIIARHMLPESGRYLIITEIVYDSHGTLADWRPLASANRNRSFRWQDVEQPISINDLATEPINAIRDGDPFIVEDTSNHLRKRAGEGMANWLLSANIKSYFFVPIMLNERPIALLNVLSRNDKLFSREEINAFSNIAGQMGALIQVRQLLEQARNARNLVDNLVLANRLVTVAADYGYMAQGITYTVARNMKGAVVALFDQPLDETKHPAYRRIVGMSTPQDLLPVDPDVKLSDIPDNTMLSKLRAGQPVIVQDLSHESGYFSLQTRTMLTELGASWVASFGLRSDNLLLGTLDLLNDSPHPLTTEEIDSYSTLADQIGVMIRTRQLITRSHAAQSMAAQLVQTNLRIATAETYDEMASAVVQSLPETITMAGILLFNEPMTVIDRPQWIKAEVLATREGVTRPDIIDYVPQDVSDAELPTLVKIFGGELVIVEDREDTERIFHILKNFAIYVREFGLRTFAGIGLRAGVRYLGIIIFGASDIDVLGDLQRENLRAIAGQVAVAIENRILVNQTADALNFVAQQYEVSSRLYRAQDYRQMLAALFQFVSEHYTQGRLGVFDSHQPTARVAAEVNAQGIVTTERGSGVLYGTPLTEEALSKDQIIISENGNTLTLPLVTTDQRLLGAVQFVNIMETVSLPRNTLLALRSLADQMTTSLLNRDLLEQTEENLQETRILYDANRALLEAGDPVDALQAIYDVVAPNAQFISLVSIGYDMITQKINSFRLEARATMNGSERLDQELAPIIGAEHLDQFQTDWRERGAEIDFAENLANDHFMRPVLEFYKNQDMEIQSNITIPIIDEGMIIQYLNVAFDEPQTFDRITRRLYKAVRDQMSIVLQNQRLMRDTRSSATQLGNQVRVLQTLNQLAINLSTFQDETALLNEAAQALYNALGLDHVGIMLLNPDGVTGRVVGEYPAHNFIGMQVADTDELQIHIRKDRVPIYIPSIEQEKNLSANSREEFKRLGIKTLLLIPLFDANEQFFGSVGLEFYQEGREFTSEMTDVARTITSQLVVALQNVRQLRRIQQQADQLQQLANFSQNLQTKLELDSILEALAEAVPTILQLDHMSVMIWDNHTAQMQVIVEVKDGKTLREARKLPQELNITTAGQAWANRQFMHIANLTKNPDLSYTLQEAMLDVMSAPIFSRGITLGIIEVGSQQAYSYSDVDLLVFRQLVNQLEVALENAEVYLQSQRVARSKALVNEISSLIQKQADLDSILNVTINELGKALGAKQARVRLGTLDNDHENTERW